MTSLIVGTFTIFSSTIGVLTTFSRIFSIILFLLIIIGYWETTCTYLGTSTIFYLKLSTWYILETYRITGTIFYWITATYCILSLTKETFTIFSRATSTSTIFYEKHGVIFSIYFIDYFAYGFYTILVIS